MLKIGRLEVLKRQKSIPPAYRTPNSKSLTVALDDTVKWLESRETTCTAFAK